MSKSINIGPSRHKREYDIGKSPETSHFIDDYEDTSGQETAIGSEPKAVVLPLESKSNSGMSPKEKKLRRMEEDQQKRELLREQLKEARRRNLKINE